MSVPMSAESARADLERVIREGSFGLVADHHTAVAKEFAQAVDNLIQARLFHTGSAIQGLAGAIEQLVQQRIEASLAEATPNQPVIQE